MKTQHSAFSTRQGKDLKKSLVDYLLKSENFQNLDECLFEIINDLNKELNQRNVAPVGGFVISELLDKFRSARKDNRYLIKINEVFV